MGRRRVGGLALAAALERRGLGWGKLVLLLWHPAPPISPSIDRFRIVPLAYTPLSHTTIRPLTSRGPPPQHLINWAHLWGKRGGNLHWKILGLSPGALHPASAGVHMWGGGGIQLAFPSPS